MTGLATRWTAGWLAAWMLLAPAAAAQADAAFASFIASAWPDAQKAGVSRATFEAATAKLEPDLSMPELTIAGRPEKPQGAQAEFVRPPADYMAERSIAPLVAGGRALASKHKATLAAIERTYGVPSPILLAVWGRETNFGAVALKYDAVRVLATYAYLGKRKEYFRGELVAALQIIERGEAKPGQLRSSYAGAMGQTQFMPSQYLLSAVDGDGDGRRDIWNSVPDALGSTGRQLLAKGWQPGQGWAYEVLPPRTLDCTQADFDITAPVGEWLKRGFRPASGAIPKADLAAPASLFLPAGTYGPAFLTLKNFYVIKSYNFADLYALFVGHVGDRIAGGGAFATPWAPLTQLRTADLAALQEELAAEGLYKEKIDGRAGQKTRVSLGAFEKAKGLKLDCWPDADDLSRLKGG